MGGRAGGSGTDRQRSSPSGSLWTSQSVWGLWIEGQSRLAGAEDDGIRDWILAMVAQNEKTTGKSTRVRSPARAQAFGRTGVAEADPAARTRRRNARTRRRRNGMRGSASRWDARSDATAADGRFHRAVS